MKYQKIVLTLHPDPDHDSLFSNIAMSWILRRMGKEVVILGGDNFSYEAFDGFIAETQTIIDGVSVSEYTEDFDLLLALDINRPARVSKNYQKGDHDVMVFDHHIGNAFPVDEHHVLYVDEKASSTCEMVFEFCEANKIALHDKHLARLYVGIYSDTVGFTTELSKNTFNIISRIRDIVSVDYLVEKLNKTWTTDDFLDFALFIKKSVIIEGALIAVGKSFVPMRKVTELASQLRNEVVVLANNVRDDYYHVEVVSSKAFPVAREIAVAIAKEFNGGGGGHLHRAGAGITATSNKEVTEKIKKIIKKIL